MKFKSHWACSICIAEFGYLPWTQSEQKRAMFRESGKPLLGDANNSWHLHRAGTGIR